MTRPGGDDRSSGQTAFVLLGGAIVGATQVGMLYALLEAGIRPNLVIGSSAGALNGAHLAGDASLEGVERLAVFWDSIGRRDILPIELRTILGGVVGRRDHLCDPLALRTLILRADIGFNRIEEAPVPFLPTATDLATGEGVALSDGDVVEALMASASTPGLFPPVDIGGRLLTDGGVVADHPLAEAEAQGATTIYVLPAAPPSITGPPRGAIDVAAWASFLSAHSTAMATSTRLASRLDVHVVPPPSVQDRSILDLGAATELIDRSYLRARSWLADDRSSARVA
jgi:NTE family protein